MSKIKTEIRYKKREFMKIQLIKAVDILDKKLLTASDEVRKNLQKQHFKWQRLCSICMKGFSSMNYNELPL